MNNNKKKWLLIDGFNMIFRCFFGVPEMRRTDGLPTNILHGFVKSVLKLEDVINPDAVCVFFDSGGSDARRDILSDYKANRPKMPEDIKVQLEYVKLLAISLGYFTHERRGIEADDLLSSFAKKISDFGELAYIFSADKDFAQCVSENILQVLPPNEKKQLPILDKEEIFKKYSVYPEQIADYLSLIGDSSDNIKGVEGVGPKTASKWLQEYHSISNILENIQSITPERFREKLQNADQLLKRNVSLIKLNQNIEYILPEAKINRNIDDFFKLLTELEMASLIKDTTKRFSNQELIF